MRQQKKKWQKRVIGRAARMDALREKRTPNGIGPALFGHWHAAIAATVAMHGSWGPLTKGPYRKPGLRGTP